jgi:trimethylamine corrinoid protein
MNEFFTQCADAILKGDKGRAADLANQVLSDGHDILDTIDKGFSSGIRQTGVLWEKGEYFLPELALSAEAMKAAMDILQPALLERDQDAGNKGTVVIGTVEGDIHDIGKTLVATMLSANGYRVIDLGSDISLSRFIDEAVEHKAGLLCMSALLTTTMAGQRQVINMLEERNLRGGIKVLVGGAPTSEVWAKDIGADAHADNAVEAVRVADDLI